ncbi:TPA: hypothetical protein ACJG9G_005750 [Salmonella enterica subsp. enterica serovar Java]|jgi:hypothetical protein
MWLLGAVTNAGMQYADSGEINPVNSVAAGWINVITMGQGWKGTIAWNAAGGALFFPKELIWFFVDSYVIENNLLGGNEWLQANKAKEYGADSLL